MKIMVFLGGLGNQIFGYAFLSYIRNRFPDRKLYGVYKKVNEHYGLEIEKWFDVNMPDSKWWVDILTGILYIYKKISPKTKILDLNQQDCINENAILYYTSKFNKRFVPQNSDWIKWKIDESNLSEKNKKVLEEIRSKESIFIHVRRGDYLSPRYKAIFEGCCTLDYYKKAIAYVNQEKTGLTFFCFSDDIPWAKENLPLKDVVFIDWNTGSDSPIDMFLMSQCKGAIMANSTFSYWGARLGVEKKIVCYPLKWNNLSNGTQDICLDSWKCF